MSQPTTWTAHNVTEALDILRAATDRLESGMRAAYPGTDSWERKEHGKNVPTALSITFDVSDLDRAGTDRSTPDTQTTGTH